MTSAAKRGNPQHIYDVVVIGGGPSGATAAHELARNGHDVALLDKAGRIKPCGGAVPPRLVRDFAIPDHLLKARITSARIVAPSERTIDMPIDGGYVGMVDRGEFDEWLRERAATAGAERITGTYKQLAQDSDGVSCVLIEQKCNGSMVKQTLRARAVIGADGANSAVARDALGKAGETPFVYAYHEIVKSPPGESFAADRCDVYYQGHLSPDFYGWVFPHGEETSVGAGTRVKGFSLRGSVGALRAAAGLADAKVIRTEGAPLPLKPLKRWDNGRDLVLTGDAAGVVAPASGEGIYYAMVGGQYAAQAVTAFLEARDPRALGLARKRFMREHGRVFWILGIMQRFWYSSDKRRERFVKMCADPDVQRLTWEAYMEKRLVRARPAAHLRIFFKDLAHLLGFAPT